MTKKLTEKELQQREIVADTKFNEKILVETIRPNGTLRLQEDYQYCVSRTDQHAALSTDLNYLIEKHKPDELAMYLAAKNHHKIPITNHDFSTEPTLQESMNITYNIKRAYEELDPEIKMHFNNHVEFVKFIDDPRNQEKMIKIGLLTRKEIQKLSSETPVTPTPSDASAAPKEQGKV